MTLAPATQVFDGADHRLEVGFGKDKNGEWQWFGLAPGAFCEDHSDSWLNIWGASAGIRILGFRRYGDG